MPKNGMELKKSYSTWNAVVDKLLPKKKSVTFRMSLANNLGPALSGKTITIHEQWVSQ